ncbi:hypothetical protein PMAYCL1PPCAC_19328 [Pristionchus mayeri]|uniref:Uncharacterized protein n=1 Tax=Pristionchus mayeri TaxID=1317129 RepID=A0AAN5CRC0_9BILA|nr:hypothetical protein PMAYCL1PPCAC_19328 [Pristionchus mayeri]
MRLCDDPKTGGITFDVNEYQSELNSIGIKRDFMSMSLHRGRLIALNPGDAFSIKQLCGGRLIVVELPVPFLALKPSTFARDSSHFFYIIFGGRLFAVDTDKCQFLQPVKFRVPMMAYSLAGVRDGTIFLRIK